MTSTALSTGETIMSRKKPEEVFTPRAHEVNERMYVTRPELERALVNALKTNKHIIVHGESGSGKSWLYKKVLPEQGCGYLVADLSNASRFNSITKEFENLISRRGDAEKKEYTESKEASADALVASGTVSHAATYQLFSKDPFERCLQFVRKQAGSKPAAIILDNFERVVGNPDLVKELGDIIALADNPDYAKHNVRLVIVGVPNDIRGYFAKIDQQNTIANRLTEIPEVERLTTEQLYAFVEKGLVTELKYKIEPETLKLAKDHICWVTDRIPQHLHEYCYELAQVIESQECVMKAGDLEIADANWLNNSLVGCYAVVEGHLNSRRTTTGRRNQAIYALGAAGKHDLRYVEVEDIIRAEFAQSTAGLQLNVVQIMAALTEGEQPLIVRTPQGDAFRFSNPKFRMCIRAMLTKDSTGRVLKLDMRRIERVNLPDEE